ncbi:hypothetical protein ERO13_A06G055401v2 [Gossypium hirsutum]|nr:hypothetical protein ERO13_A06G055401v2 [Gossypium hirsutum]KAG4194479.1 hypothetical protein ERO13_A06G055401v2 [Gossypium hirsutum]
MRMLLLGMGKGCCCEGSILKPGVRPSVPKPPNLSLILSFGYRTPHQTGSLFSFSPCHLFPLVHELISGEPD